MRYKPILFFGLLIVLILGIMLLPGRFFQPAKAQGSNGIGIGSLPPLLKLSKVIRHSSSSRILQMSMGLTLQNRSQLDTLLSQQYNPASPNYHQFLTVAQFTQQFSPSPAQQQQVIDYLTQQGFTITQTYPDRLMIDFSGPASLAEHVFGVTINDYSGPKGFNFFSNANVPTLPASIAADVAYIGGLDNANIYRHPPVLSRSKPALSGKAGANCPTEGHGSGSATSQVAYIPSQFATAYDYAGLHNAGLLGAGQTVGVFELDGYSQSDVQTYTQCFGGGNVSVSNVVLDGFNGQPGQGAVEVELDMEVIMSMAPKLGKLLVYEAPNTTQGYNDEFARIVNDRTPVVSVSWGDCETNMTQQEVQQENTFFQTAAAQGQTILVASGDSGSETCFQQTYNPALITDDPASQPFVTGVGGTNLTLNNSNTYASEHVWNGGLLGGAGGGGLSQYWKQPSWQTGPGTHGSYANGMRQVPDVSLDADPTTGYPIYCTAGSSCSSSGGIGGIGSASGWLTIGGTSAAAPMWAAMVALANEEAAVGGKGPVGFLNPALYQIASGANYHTDFHDIVPPTDPTIPSNNDEVGINGGAYPVTNGYDMATGWGSFDATKLTADLVRLAK